MKQYLSRFSVIILSLFLFACGGGSSDSPSQTSAQQTKITSELNAYAMDDSLRAQSSSEPILLEGELKATNTETGDAIIQVWKAYLDLEDFSLDSQTTVGLQPGSYVIELLLKDENNQYYGVKTQDIENGEVVVDMVLAPLLGQFTSDISSKERSAEISLSFEDNQISLADLDTPYLGITLNNGEELRFLINKSVIEKDPTLNILFGEYELDLNIYDDEKLVGRLALPDQKLVVDETFTASKYALVPMVGITVLDLGTDEDSAELILKLPKSIVEKFNDFNAQLLIRMDETIVILDKLLTFAPSTDDPSSLVSIVTWQVPFGDVRDGQFSMTLKLFEESSPLLAFASCQSDIFSLQNQSKTIGCQLNFNPLQGELISALSSAVIINVYDINGNPVKGANIYLDDETAVAGVTGQSVHTSDGALVLNVAPGERVFRVEALGFGASETVTLNPLSITNLDMNLYRRINTDPTVDVNNYDIRRPLEVAEILEPSSDQISLENVLRLKLPQVQVKHDKRYGTTRVLYNKTGYLTEANPAQTSSDTVDNFLSEHKALLGLSTLDIQNVVQQINTTETSGTERHYLNQKHHGLDVVNAILQVNLNRDGRVISVNNTFTPYIDSIVPTKEAPVVSAQQAIINGSRALGVSVGYLPKIETQNRLADDMATVLSSPSASIRPIKAKLVYYPIKARDIRLAWNFLLVMKGHKHVYDVMVDAKTGEVLAYFDQVDYDSYEVFPYPVESPSHATPVDTRQIVVNPAASPGSPWGWHDTNATMGAEYTIMRGNNVHAYDDSNNSGSPSSVEPDCGAGLACIFPLDLTLPPEDNMYSAIANLFYWNNIIHDITYLYGFDQASGNFQVNQYGAGGVGGDDVRAEAQDGGGMNNANFWTPADGTRPRMQMYNWSLTTPNRDGDFDAGIIVHEYAHGISNRLVGGPSNVNCLSNTQRPSEGISDLYGLMMTQPAGGAGTDPRGIGTYALGQPITGAGIRPQQYSTDPAINTYTYETISSGMSVPHGVGSVWAQAAWEVYWALVDQHGFDIDLYNHTAGKGNHRAMLYFTEGLKNTVCSPSFTETRDGIIQAAIDNYSGEDVCLIWQAFADFGLGSDAVSPSSSSLSVTNGFSVPEACDDTDVWVEDTHYDYTGPNPDLGNEPDANMTGKSMWRSKAIWNRTSVSSPGSHQNPEFGQQNEIYVNVQNRGAATAYNTTVEVYWANASTGLSWPGDWNLLGTDTIGSLAAGSNTNANVVWTPPGTGHYCFIARLVNPQDPLTFVETSDVNYNTRQNNNIAWRNMNIVDLLSNLTQITTFNAGLTLKSSHTLTLQVGTQEQIRFIRDGGAIRINLVEATGDDRWIEVTKMPFHLGDIKLPDNRRSIPLQIMFEAGPMPITHDEVGKYHIDIIQLENTDNGQLVEVGGVAYELQTRTYLTDTDRDGESDIEDSDDDNDTIPDYKDPYPLDKTR
ncbi:M36 family metallopeptidase [Vibrio sagamiensis]|uniref:Peptidase M36 n=1 Tax=Vibrio sagamiensis NBRC 104589 TaxID=1219064 RepID=A0A511QGH7_9VIBR|nr:M36 family metallopeptidase [Vibrio sagamiensis]GEM75552.1 hypothetical protein VSA01S_16640 [Vibrio sagamiensis NBRC 104589]